MPFVVTECDSREIPFFHHDRAFRRFNSHHTSTTSVDQGLTTKAISPRFLSEAERIEIADRRHAGETVRAIADAIKRAPSTVSRELRRNCSSTGAYQPHHATEQLRCGANDHGPPNSLLIQNCWRSSKTFWRSAGAPPRSAAASAARSLTDLTGTLYRRPSTKSSIGPTACCCADPHPRRCARAAITAAHTCVSPGAGGASPNRCSACTSVGLLPEDRSQPGHWEGDVIVGPQHRSAIGTLVERQSRLVKLIPLPRPDSFELRDGLLRELAGLPAALLQSITWEQGSEMARHLEITAATGAKVYFCDAGSPWQRGTNENTNGLLRQYFPKGTDLSRHNRSDLARVEHELNNRPRAVLHDRTPGEIFTQLLTSKTVPMLQ